MKSFAWFCVGVIIGSLLISSVIAQSITDPLSFKYNVIGKVYAFLDAEELAKIREACR